MQRTNAQKLDELAHLIERTIGDEELNPCCVDSELASSCLKLINTMRRSLPTQNLVHTPCIRTETDAAIRAAFSLGDTWDEETRVQFYEHQIATIDLLNEDCTDKVSDLRDAAVFVRALVIGVENYKLKLTKMQRK